jgi:4-nitrophenyl phosphatase
MKKYNGYLLDLDGTVYRGRDKIEAAVDFVKELRARKIPYVFVTNNSSMRPEQVAEKLNGLGVPAVPEEVMTSGMATANALAEEGKYETVYLIGEEGVETAIQEKGMRIVEERADAVVVGIDRGINYEKLTRACNELAGGAAFYATNPDVAFPAERGLLPGNGALTALLATATGRKPTFIGKPEAAIIEQALERLGVEKEKTLMVGDNYETDILAGMRAGMDTLLVHTGVTSKDALGKYKEKPTYTADSLMEWNFGDS